MANVLATPFATMTLEDARKVVQVAVAALSAKINVVPFDRGVMIPEWVLANPIMLGRAFVMGDHWQGGLGWVGPRPQIDDPAYTETMAEIARQFVSKNVIGEVVHRHVGGVVGIEPHWGFTQIAELEQGQDIAPDLETKIDEVEALLTPWWNVRRMHEIIQEVVGTMCYAERALLRLYVPRGLLQDVKVADDAKPGEMKVIKAVVAKDMEEALSLIYVEHPLPDRATVALDEDTKEYLGVVMFMLGGQVIGLPGTNERAELSYLDGPDDRPLTVLRSVGKDSNNEVTLDLGGRLTMYEAQRTLLISPQMWQSQKALNLALSMLPRGVVSAGFLERTILNAQMPGEWELDKDGKKKRFVPAPYYTGPGTTNMLQGIELVDQKTGTKTLTTPQINYREAATQTPTIETARAHYVDLLEEGQQEHVMAVHNSGASGKTHEQARADFKMSLTTSQSRIEPMGRWLLETLVAMAESFVGTDRPYTSQLRAYFDCRLDVGPVTAAERQQNDASFKSGTLSRETAIVRNGESDPDAELIKIASQPGGELDLIERQAAVILELTQAGGTLEGAATAAGLAPDLITKLVGSGVPPANTPPAQTPPTSKRAAKKKTGAKPIVAKKSRRPAPTPPAPAPK